MDESYLSILHVRGWEMQEKVLEKTFCGKSFTPKIPPKSCPGSGAFQRRKMAEKAGAEVSSEDPPEDSAETLFCERNLRFWSLLVAMKNGIKNPAKWRNCQ